MKRLMKKLFRPLKKKATDKQGFTLLEILVVLTIMGFLIAMVAPRLAGISGGAVDTVCDTNQNRMMTYMSSYFEQTNKFPNKLTNLVDRMDGGDDLTAARYQIPAVSDGDPDNGPETLALEFNDRNHFHIHYLSDDEQKELRDMGISTIFNLNAYDVLDDTGTVNTDYVQSGDEDYADVADRSPAMEEVELAVDDDGTDGYDNVIAVAMVGMGVNADGGSTWQGSLTERNWGEPEFLGRIVFGMGPECGLITSGIIGNAAHCPGGLQNADNATYNDYNLVLPRLAATADIMNTGTLPTEWTGVDLSAIAAVSYDDDPGDGYDIDENDDNLRYRTFDISEAQEGWQYATQCPEGHMYPEDDGEFWGIDLDGGNTLNTLGTTTP